MVDFHVCKYCACCEETEEIDWCNKKKCEASYTMEGGIYGNECDDFEYDPHKDDNWLDAYIIESFNICAGEEEF